MPVSEPLLGTRKLTEISANVDFVREVKNKGGKFWGED